MLLRFSAKTPSSQVEELAIFTEKKMKILPIFKSLRLPSPQEFRCLYCLVSLLLFLSTPSGSEKIPRALRAWQRRLLRLLS